LQFNNGGDDLLKMITRLRNYIKLE